RRRITITAVKRSAGARVDQILLGDNEALVVVAFDRNTRDAIRESIEINTNVFFRFFAFLFVLFLFLFFFSLGLVSACRFFAFLCEGNFVAFRREWILHVFAERECEQPCAAASRIIEFDLAKRWLKVMHGNV